ncbi:MAG: transposase family protein [Desulfamplus sp.]|nr:transposase family protein [Desulfamplus sp.]
MLNVKNAMKSDRLMKAITGMTVDEFLAILPVFSKLLHETAVSKERVRQPGGGAIHTLFNTEAKLFYTLFYLKCYPAFDLAAFFYNVDRAQTCRWTHGFMPILEKALGKELVLPVRQIKSAEEFIRLFPEIKEVFIDGTERPVERSKNKEKQKQD